MSPDRNAAGLARGDRFLNTKSTRGLTICFLVLLLDGLDTTSIAFVAPILAQKWSIPVSSFTFAFVATSFGAVVGYVVCGPLTQSLGSRVVGAAFVALFGFGTLSMAAAWDVTSLSALRFVSAVGLGGVVPIAIVAASDLVSARHKETAVLLVASGLSAGAATGGLVGGPLMSAYGWKAVFVLGGALPFFILPPFVRLLRVNDSLGESPATDRSGASLVVQLFADGLAERTGLLWTFAFLIFVVTHALIFWTPTLLLELDFEQNQAPLATAAFGMGGLIGSVMMVLFVPAFGTRRLLAAACLLSMACVVAVGRIDLSPSTVLLLITGLGAGTVTGCIGQAALAVSLYPRRLRTTGIGFATAMGRIGSLLGPAVGGLLLLLGWPARYTFMTVLVPLSLALLVLAWLSVMLHRPAV